MQNIRFLEKGQIFAMILLIISKNKEAKKMLPIFFIFCRITSHYCYHH